SGGLTDPAAFRFTLFLRRVTASGGMSPRAWRNVLSSTTGATDVAGAGQRRIGGMHTRRLPGPGPALLPVVLIFVLFSPSADRPAVVTVAALPQAAAKAAAPWRVDGDAQMQDLQALASPELEGRLTGTPGNRRAQALI